MDDASPGGDGPVDDGGPGTAGGTTVEGEPRPDSQRRLVSVVFVDLVGFTTFAEGRDPEIVREVQTAYFERARDVIDRYGGTVEKFIGDAVMAVWGTPTAQEDDAERAVRAALELIEGIPELCESAGWSRASARAGVVTGEAAVRLAAVGQAMVTGDVVNTAARVQAVAQPGSVLVDDTTRTLSSASVAYRSAGERQLKGRMEPVRLFAALEASAGSAEGPGPDGLQAAFVGRDSELRTLKELFHQTVDRSRARSVVVSGEAGVGKSRLVSELFEYIDAIELPVLWHVGRSRSYADDVAYRALADMVRMRLRVSGSDEEEVLSARLDDAMVGFVDDERERAWLRPRLAALLGIGEAAGTSDTELERDTLFAGWRRFFELLAERDPVVLVFEDVQAADTGQLDFIDHLLEWSAARPIFVVMLARPELLELRPQWSAAQHAVVVMHLDPLPVAVVERLLDSLVTRLPEEIRRGLAVRAEGMPLFALETVRMLIDRELVVSRDGHYTLAVEGLEVGNLAVPPTLRALVAARLDALPDDEALLVTDASVLGASFQPQTLAALVRDVGGIDVGQVDELLRTLTRREVLSIRADTHSPEAGRYRFVQQVLRTVAYERLSRRDRKARHLAAATHLASTDDVGDLAGLVAAHYLDAADAVPDDPDAPGLRATAVGHLERAGERARSLAAHDEARQLFVRAFDLADEDADRARLAERAGLVSHRQGHPEIALGHYDDAARLLGANAPSHRLVELACQRADALLELGQAADALEALTAVEGRTTPAASGASVARLALEMGRAHSYLGADEAALACSDRACAAAEHVRDPDLLSNALNARAAILDNLGRPIEARGLFKIALELAAAHDLPYRAVLPACNLAQLLTKSDLELAEHYAREGTEHAHRVGAHNMLATAATCLVEAQLLRGAWDDIDEPALRELLRRRHGSWLWWPLSVLATLSLWRGTPADLGAWLDDAPLDDVMADTSRQEVCALLALQGGDLDTAFAIGDELVDNWQHRIALGASYSWPVLITAALDADRVDVARRYLDAVTSAPATSIEPLDAVLQEWLQARLADVDGQHAAAHEQRAAAIRALREIGATWWLAQALLDAAEQACAGGRDSAHELATEAHDLLVSMGATPSLRRAQTLLERLTGAAAARDM